MRKRMLMALAFVGVVTLVMPMPASALPIVGGPDLPSLDPSSYVVDGFRAILKFLFGSDLDKLGRSLVNLLLGVPLLTDKAAFPQLNAYRGYVEGGAWGLLGLTGVIAALRYFASSMTGSGAYEALNGFIRTAGAICMLLVFVPAFDGLSRATNMMTAALIKGSEIHHQGGHGISAALSADNIAGGGVVMLVTVAAMGMAIVLLVVKAIVTALLAVLFVASPLAIALWPVEEVGVLLRTLLQGIFGLLIFPCVWAICFAVLAVLPADALFPGGKHDGIDSFLSPLITLAALIIAFRLPFKVLEMMLQAGISPGINRGISSVRNASYARTALTGGRG
jgi:hypothetical protein